MHPAYSLAWPFSRIYQRKALAGNSCAEKLFTAQKCGVG
jgi:hypothetical protein